MDPEAPARCVVRAELSPLSLDERIQAVENGFCRLWKEHIHLQLQRHGQWLLSFILVIVFVGLTLK